MKISKQSTIVRPRQKNSLTSLVKGEPIGPGKYLNRHMVYGARDGSPKELLIIAQYA
jgi:hypothetical protein